MTFTVAVGATPALPWQTRSVVPPPLSLWAAERQAAFVRAADAHILSDIAVPTGIGLAVTALLIAGTITATNYIVRAENADAIRSVSDENGVLRLRWASWLAAEKPDAIDFGRGPSRQLAEDFPMRAVLVRNIPLQVRGPEDVIEAQLLQLISDRTGLALESIGDLRDELAEGRGEIAIPGCVTNHPDVVGVRAFGRPNRQGLFERGYVVPLFDGSFLFVKPTEEFRGRPECLVYQRFVHWPAAPDTDNFLEQITTTGNKRLRSIVERAPIIDA